MKCICETCGQEADDCMIERQKQFNKWKKKTGDEVISEFKQFDYKDISGYEGCFYAIAAAEKISEEEVQKHIDKKKAKQDENQKYYESMIGSSPDNHSYMQCVGCNKPLFVFDFMKSINEYCPHCKLFYNDMHGGWGAFPSNPEEFMEVVMDLAMINRFEESKEAYTCVWMNSGKNVYDCPPSGEVEWDDL